MKLTMTGRLSECVLLAYRTPADSVRHLVPPALELMSRDGEAFWNIVACRIDAMRPRGVPAAFGMSYHHVAYRLYVRAHIAGGNAIDGLYFIRSDVDRAPIAWCGDLLSDFRFHQAEIDLRHADDRISLRVRSNGGADATMIARRADRSLPSPAFLKYRPLALSCDRGLRLLKLAEVVRDEAEWRESPLDVIEARWALLEQLRQSDLRLVSATRVAPIDYTWKLGQRLPLVAAHAGASTSLPASASLPACSTTSGRG